jgi:cystathionine beta-synthase
MTANVATRARVRAMPGVRDSILETIGGTPLVRLSRLGHEVAADLIAKVEPFNPGGSVKDRIGIAIVEDAEQSGRLKPGGTIVEATSGNTGVGLAIAAALRGYHCIFVMPDKMSDEKIRLLRAFGARVVITPTAVEPDDPRSYYSVARRLVEETPNAILANQYHNPANPASHYRSTGPEIWADTAGRVSHFICCLGTGGTISGAGRFLKEQRADVQVVGVDPVGSILHDFFYTGILTPAHSYKVEGIGEDFVPSTTDFSVVDDVVQVTDAESFAMTRRLVREEGIFAGGSSGSAVAGALQYIRDRQLGPEAVVVVLLPDSGNRYLSKVFNDDWMREHGFATSEHTRGHVADILAARGERAVQVVPPSAPISEVVARMKANDISQLPVVGAGGQLLGIVSERDVLTRMLEPDQGHAADETIESITSNRVAAVEPGTTLEVLGQIFAQGDVAVVRSEGRVSAVITKIDLIDYLTQSRRA